MLKLNKKRDKVELVDAGNFEGLEVKSRKAKKVVIIDKDLKSKYSRIQVDKKLKKCYGKIYDFLMSEDDSEEGIKACLGEIEKIKEMIFIRYKEFLTNKMYKEFLAKIAITEREFKNKYYERAYFAKMIESLSREYNYEYDELEERGVRR